MNYQPKTNNMIYITIEHEDGKRSIRTRAENMKELIDTVMPREAPRLENDLDLLKMTSRFKSDPEGEEQKERDSGWYYDC